MQNETITVTIKKTDLNFIKTSAIVLDSTIQSLCATVLSKELDSKVSNPQSVKELKLSLSKISLGATEAKQEIERIFLGIENGKN